MLLWYVFLGCILLILAGVFVFYKWSEDVGGCMVVAFGLASFALLLVCGLLSSEAKQNYVAFVKAKSIVEHKINEVQNKTELNEWLIEAQVERELNGDWSFTPVEVLEMSPIE